MERTKLKEHKKHRQINQYKYSKKLRNTNLKTSLKESLMFSYCVTQLKKCTRKRIYCIFQRIYIIILI